MEGRTSTKEKLNKDRRPSITSCCKGKTKDTSFEDSPIYPFTKSSRREISPENEKDTEKNGGIKTNDDR